jgi:hypothetical protein
MIYVVPLLVFPVALFLMLGAGWLTGREPRIPLARLTDPAPMPGELGWRGRCGIACTDCVDTDYGLACRADLGGSCVIPASLYPFVVAHRLGLELGWCGRCGHCHGQEGCPPRDLAGPFPVDTGPLLIVGEALAANAALEREVRAMIRAAERKIGPVR